MFCSNCSKKIKQGSNRCDKCGRQVQLEGIGSLDVERLYKKADEVSEQPVVKAEPVHVEEAKPAKNTFILPIALCSVIVTVALIFAWFNFKRNDTEKVYTVEVIEKGEIKSKEDAQKYVEKTFKEKGVLVEYSGEETVEGQTVYKFKQVVELDEKTKLDVFDRYASVCVPEDGDATLQHNCIEINNKKELKKQKEAYDELKKQGEENVKEENDYRSKIDAWLETTGYEKGFEDEGKLGVYCENEDPYVALLIKVAKTKGEETKELTFIVRAAEGKIAKFPNEYKEAPRLTPTTKPESTQKPKATGNNDKDGAKDGDKDGDKDGNKDDDKDGAKDGDKDGAKDGNKDGDKDGDKDGNKDGAKDGDKDGDKDGNKDGDKDGDKDGNKDVKGTNEDADDGQTVEE